MIDQRFFSYNKTTDWEQGKAYNLQVQGTGLKINQLEKYSTSKTIRFSNLEGIGEIKDFSLGSNQNLYILDHHANIWFYDLINDHYEALFSSKDKVCTKRTMIDSIANTLFLADSESEHKLAAYSVTNGQMKWYINEWNNTPLYPLAIHNDGQEHLYVVVPTEVKQENEELYLNEETQVAILKIHSTGKIVQIFNHNHLSFKQNSSIIDMNQQFILSVSNEGRMVLLNTSTGVLFQFLPDGSLMTYISILPALKVSSLALDADQYIYMGEAREISSNGEDDRFILKLLPSTEPQAQVSALRGRVDKIRFDSKHRMYVLNCQTNELTLLGLHLRTRELAGSGRLMGVHFTTAFDSTETETEWHKIMLDAQIPEETQIRVSYFTSDRKDFFINDTYIDMDEYILDEAVLLQEKLDSLHLFWLETLVNPLDALIFKGKGRYLWLKIEWIGSEFKTPSLNSFRIYYPKASYLSYLPAVYQEDSQSKDFLERYLALFQTLFMEIEEEVDQVSRNFDADIVSGSFLEWLSAWLGISPDDNWTEEQLKLLIRKAPELYQVRGTKQAIEKMIEIYIGKQPIVIEFFQYKAMRKEKELRKVVDRLYGSNPYCFTVIVEQPFVKSEKDRLMLEKILKEQKPAFTEANLVILETSIYLDMHSYLGMNSYLAEPTLMILDQQSSMPHNTLLIDVDQENRLDTHTRLELDSELE